MPPDSIADPNNPVLSSELYDLLVRGGTVLVVVLFIWCGWVFINRMMSPERRQEAQNRRIRKAVAAREGLRETREATEEKKSHTKDE